MGRSLERNRITKKKRRRRFFFYSLSEIGIGPHKGSFIHFCECTIKRSEVYLNLAPLGDIRFSSSNLNLFNQDCFCNLLYQQSISCTLDSNHFQSDEGTLQAYPNATHSFLCCQVECLTYAFFHSKLLFHNLSIHEAFLYYKKDISCNYPPVKFKFVLLPIKAEKQQIFPDTSI